MSTVVFSVVEVTALVAVALAGVRVIVGVVVTLTVRVRINVCASVMVWILAGFEVACCVKHLDCEYVEASATTPSAMR